MDAGGDDGVVAQRVARRVLAREDHIEAGIARDEIVLDEVVG